MSYQNIIDAEHAWCKQFLRNKQIKLNALLGLDTKTPQLLSIKRQRFDCRTQEAKIQQEVFKMYEPALLELDAKILELSASSRIIPTHVSPSATQPTDFQLRCDTGVSEDFINSIGKTTFDKFESRFVK
jgi:hypothetical protein